MKVITAILLSFLAVTHAWTLPSPVNYLAKACATGAVCAALAAPLTAQASDDTTFKINVDAPYIINLVKTKESRTQTFERAQFLADSLKNFLGPAVSVELPTDLQGLAKKAFSGGGTVSVNGIDVGVQVVKSENGALTVTLSNALIPRIPFAGLSNTPAVVNAAADGVAAAVPGVVDFVTTNLKEGPIWDRPIFGGKYRVDLDFGGLAIHKAVTPLDIAGGGSLGLGVAYGASFAFYQYELAKEAREAEEKKKSAAEKKKTAAVPKKAEKAATNVNGANANATGAVVADAEIADDIESAAEARKEESEAPKTSKLRDLLKRK
jgi:hypothetical protein